MMSSSHREFLYSWLIKIKKKKKKKKKKKIRYRYIDSIVTKHVICLNSSRRLHKILKVPYVPDDYNFSLYVKIKQIFSPTKISSTVSRAP